jgi:lycopene beta-cyclase
MSLPTLAIIGGGCAGLSLARDLARASRPDNPAPDTTVLEPRTQYQPDRTWCFWAHGEAAYHPLIQHRWSRWRFSTATTQHTQSAPDWHYCCVPSERFYDDARDAIDQASGIQLKTGVTVHAIRPSGSRFALDTSAGTLEVDAVVDTRPPALHTPQRGLIQQFAGALVETSVADPALDTVGLMEHMQTDTAGFRFVYTLPFNNQQQLIETTRFCPIPIPDAQMESELQQAIEQVTGGREVRIIRREGGCIPMTPSQPEPQADARIVLAGTRGGGVRPSTGYAFQRIQRWSSRCARALIESGRPISHPPDPRATAWMDRLFLSVLRTYPERTPHLFLQLAQRTRPDALVRYLSDQASPADALAVIRALPPGLFLRHAVMQRGAY